MHDPEGHVMQLTNQMPGDWLVHTRSGTNCLIIIAEDGYAEMQRIPARLTPHGDWSPSMYRDGEALACKLISMKVGEEGHLAFFKTDENANPRYLGSTRRTTVIESIVRLDLWQFDIDGLKDR